MSAPVEGPDDGHTFRISFCSRGSYAVVGEPGHHDASDYGGSMTAEVRAWNFRDALAKAMQVPLDEWSVDDD